MLKRTHDCGELRRDHVGQEVALCGWVHSRRDHGGVIFIDLRDRYGIAQVVFHPEENAELAQAHDLRSEFVVAVRGAVRNRPDGTENPKLATGEVEVVAGELHVLNRCEPLPFPVEEGQNEGTASEELRLQYRYVDLRRSAMQANLRLRHRILKTVRDYADAQGFIEVETPILSKSTPEGARDYLVPSRVHAGKFYALPQAPQQYKQLLMVGGIDKYIQIARCFRDEDLRAHRQPEFTQIDLEMSFVEPQDIQTVIEGMFQGIFRDALGRDLTIPFERMPYAQAIDRFGTDAPDLRYGMELVDAAPALAATEFKVFRKVIDGGGAIRAICAPGLASASLREIEEWTSYVRQFGAGGLAWIKVDEQGEFRSSIAKFFTEPEQTALRDALGAKPGSLLLFVADEHDVACESLGRLRILLAEHLGMVPENEFRFVWVVDFPLLEWSETEGRYAARHHPFTRPVPEDLDLLETEPGRVRAEAYDVVCNGIELGGGSIRIHEPELQRRAFRVLGIGDEEAALRFGHLLKALALGAPPHGGIALGVDRVVMSFGGLESIRDVIAFPKTQKAACLMSGSPAEVDPRQLHELHIRVDLPDPSGRHAGSPRRTS